MNTEHHRRPLNVARVAAGLVVTPFVASPFEWLVRRQVYHRAARVLRRIHTVHVAHHHLYFPTRRCVTGGPAREALQTA